MKNKRYLTTINFAIIFFITICILGVFTYKFQSKKLNFEKLSVQNTNSIKKKISRQNTNYNAKVAKILSAEKFDLSVQDINIYNNKLNANLVYKKSVNDFISNNKIQKFFINNKCVNINNIILKENKVIINIDCIV